MTTPLYRKIIALISMGELRNNLAKVNSTTHRYQWNRLYVDLMI